ncbi:hypothetical protein BH10ACT1_BH10ACT1_17280 [soil metagenome]
MNDPTDPTDPIAPGPGDDDDPILADAGARLRAASPTISPATIEVAVLRRRARRVTALAGASLLVVALLGGLLVAGRDSGSDPGSELASNRPGAPARSEVDHLLSILAAKPVDPRKVKLVSSVSTFEDCDGLIGDLRKVGAQHVGSRGFGGYSEFSPVGEQLASADARTARSDAASPAATGEGGATTLGTNVQVEGVDELDHVKAVGKLIYDLDAKGDLRITDTESLKVLSTLDVTPGKNDDDGSTGRNQVDQLLVAGGKVALFGSEFEVSKPIAGDPSATQASTEYMTVTFVDATNPSVPKVSDRVRVEGSLVSARLVAGEIRLVTTSNMTDLGFVVPTTPNSVAKALEQNRRSVASSTAPDWIPDWQRQGEAAEPLVPCGRVHVPDTFSGVAMTSMVTFPLGSGRFEPAGTSILAPATTLYAGLDKVAISSEVWVDPIDRDRLEFEDWRTAIHEFSFADDTAPTYAGSGIVDGSTVGQFAYGEIGTSLAVVTSKGTPWQQDLASGIDLTILTPDGKGGLTQTAKVDGLAKGGGGASAVRFVQDRVLISTGSYGRDVLVLDVTDPAKPRQAGRLTLSGAPGYFHPLPDHQALVIGSRTDTVGTGNDKQNRSWVQAQLLDVTNADAPRVLSVWERPWTADEVGSDHHAFTYWPDRRLAMWGLQNTQFGSGKPNEAAVLDTTGGVKEVAVPVASKPDEVPSPCPAVSVTDPEARKLLPAGGVVLRCGDKAQKELEWPRYECYRLDGGTIARIAAEDQRSAAFFLCTPAPQPTVSRVLVVDGKPILLTDQTLEVLDPQTFQSTSVTYHPSTRSYGGI